jgi:cellulose biosynthesis protein BcsQ
MLLFFSQRAYFGNEVTRGKSEFSSAGPMENNEIQNVSRGGPQKELANDVAMLFSWAKMQNAPYRDFSRQPKRSPSPPVHTDAPSSIANAAPANIDVCSPELRAVFGSEQTTPIEPRALPSHNSGTLPSLNQDVPPVSKAGMRAAHVGSGKPSPVIGIYSVAGGAGKTTVSANLAKTLCSLGEQLLLVDASGRGLLPFYFGATELKAGTRKFVAPGLNAPFIQTITAGVLTSEWLDDEVKPLMSGSQRTIFDLGPLCGSLLPTIFSMCTLILIPLLPDLNSIVTVAAIESSMNAQSTGLKPPTVFYLFNRFDEQSINDQQAREFVARQCGNRILPTALRHDWTLTEALHGGISASDHTPGSELSHDYLELALWVRRVAPLSPAMLLPGRWSEQ